MTVDGAIHPPGSDSAEGAAFADILCAVDGSPESFAAVEQAAGLAGRGGHLTLLEVTSYDFQGANRGPAVGPLQAKRTLDRAAELAREAGVSATVEVDPESPPAQVVLDWAAERDLLAIGAPTTSWFRGMFTSGVAVSAEGSFSTPLLIARLAREVPTADRHILVASDGQEGSDQLVELAAGLARAQGADVTLVHAVGHGSGARRRRVEEQARALSQLADPASELRLERGHARTVIVETAGSIGASLIVMGSRRLTGPLVLGSVSRRVVHQGHCSVLLVPPERLLAG